MAYEQAAPTKTAFTIVPSDTVPTREPYRHLAVGGIGDIVIKNADGTTATLKVIVEGEVFRDFAPSFIMATGTTATDLVGLK